MSVIPTPLSLGRSLSNETVERSTRAAFNELESAPFREVIRRACDTRDILDGIRVETVNPAERERVVTAASAEGVTR
jgi:hypothetical protein